MLDKYLDEVLFADKIKKNQGFGKSLLKAWERNTRIKGYNYVLISTQANEDAQNFYRHLGYKDSGSLLFDKQPTELLMYRTI